jgi:hypothetical protein
MESQTQNTSSTSNQGIDEQHRNRHKTDLDRTEDGQLKGTELNETKNNSEARGFADHANIKSTLNEDKSTISDTSAPSESMQDEKMSKSRKP